MFAAGFGNSMLPLGCIQILLQEVPGPARQVPSTFRRGIPHWRLGPCLCAKSVAHSSSLRAIFAGWFTRFVRFWLNFEVVKSGLPSGWTQPVAGSVSKREFYNLYPHLKDQAGNQPVWWDLILTCKSKFYLAADAFAGSRTFQATWG